MVKHLPVMEGIEEFMYGMRGTGEFVMGFAPEFDDDGLALDRIRSICLCSR